jgi:serine/threonine-protein kinase
MGEVYLARSEGASGFHRPVVIKRILAQHAEDKLIIDLFRREAKVMSSLRHPNIVSVLDFGQDQGDHVMVIEYVHGFHLGRWMRWLAQNHQPFPVERAVEIVITVLDALQHAHEAKRPDGTSLGIVHRDVSPANVLIDVEGTVKLADFGIARMEGEHTEVIEGEQLTVKGKFPYLPPESFEGEQATAQTDVYAAAVVLDEVLRGRNAFRMGQVAETLGRVLKYVPEPLDTLRADVSPALAQVIARGIAKKRDERFATAADLAKALRAARNATPDEARRELGEAARRDFLDPEIAILLDVPDLAGLETLWHGEVPDFSETAREPHVSGIATAAELRLRSNPPPEPEPAPPPARPLRAPLYAAAAVAVLGVAGGGAWVALRDPGLAADGPVVVVVDRTARSDAGSAPRADVDAASAVPDAYVAPPTRDDDAPHAPRARAAVEAPFRARASDIGRCFTMHVREVGGAPELTVRFEVDGDGTVQRASIAPSELESTPLGACLLEVARTTRFAASGAPISFRVPLGARRAQ